MAFHPQTDWLSESVNKQVTRYLQGFTTHRIYQWGTMVPLAEYAYNTSRHPSTNQSLFELDPGYTPCIPSAFVAGQLWHEEIWRLEGAVFIE